MTAPVIFRDLDGTEHRAPYGSASRYYFDTRANRALRGTLTGESMAEWGPRYIREARAMLSLNRSPGQLWERVAS